MPGKAGMAPSRLPPSQAACFCMWCVWTQTSRLALLVPNRLSNSLLRSLCRRRAKPLNRVVPPCNSRSNGGVLCSLFPHAQHHRRLLAALADLDRITDLHIFPLSQNNGIAQALQQPSATICQNSAASSCRAWA